MHSVSELIEDIRAGKMVILVDDENRENEGDLILAADFVTPQAINFMAREARGLICLALQKQQISALGLPLMVKDDANYSPNKTAFTVSIEAAEGVSTGISAADRSHTIRVAASPNAKASDIIMPGHVFPIRAREGGVLKRAGHTEASVDLAQLAGLNPSAVICEIMNQDGSMARLPDLLEFADEHDIKIGTIESLIEYRIENESFVDEIQDAEFPTEFGTGFRAKLFRNQLDGREHVVVYKGDLNTDEPVCVRVHTECVMGDVFRSQRSSGSRLIEQALRNIDDIGRGALVYLRQEDMENRLEKRFAVYRDMERGEIDEGVFRRAFGSDQKEYGVGAQILRSLGLRKIVLLSNSPNKRVGLKGYGIEIVDSLQMKSEVQINA